VGGSGDSMSAQENPWKRSIRRHAHTKNAFSKNGDAHFAAPAANSTPSFSFLRRAGFCPRVATLGDRYSAPESGGKQSNSDARATCHVHPLGMRRKKEERPGVFLLGRKRIPATPGASSASQVRKTRTLWSLPCDAERVHHTAAHRSSAFMNLAIGRMQFASQRDLQMGVAQFEKTLPGKYAQNFIAQ